MTVLCTARPGDVATDRTRIHYDGKDPLLLPRFPSGEYPPAGIQSRRSCQLCSGTGPVLGDARAAFRQSIGACFGSPRRLRPSPGTRSPSVHRLPRERKVCRENPKRLTGWSETGRDGDAHVLTGICRSRWDTRQRGEMDPRGSAFRGFPGGARGAPSILEITIRMGPSLAPPKGRATKTTTSERDKRTRALRLSAPASDCCS